MKQKALKKDRLHSIQINFYDTVRDKMLLEYLTGYKRKYGINKSDLFKFGLYEIVSKQYGKEI